tara:strand:+ start:38 stop:238 length:201 start_codon:yes stop_codon:yes gene_type:complete
MKVGDLVRWKSSPGLIINKSPLAVGHDIMGFDVLFANVPPALVCISKGGIVTGFKPYELKVISENG